MTRRTAIGLLVLTAAACQKHSATTGVVRPVVVPDAAALVAARDGERLLLAFYDHAIAHAKRHQLPALRVARAVHATHLEALRGTQTSTADIAAVSNLRHALLASVRRLQALSLAATEGTNAALLASIAASHQASAA
jgi:hypothetical protein